MVTASWLTCISLSHCPHSQHMSFHQELPVVKRAIVWFPTEAQIHHVQCSSFICQVASLVRGGNEVCFVPGEPTLSGRTDTCSSMLSQPILLTLFQDFVRDQQSKHWCHVGPPPPPPFSLFLSYCLEIRDFILLIFSLLIPTLLPRPWGFTTKDTQEPSLSGPGGIHRVFWSLFSFLLIMLWTQHELCLPL